VTDKNRDEFLRGFQFLWDGSGAGWVLLDVSGPDWVEEYPYAIVNEETRQSLIIENDEVRIVVLENMLRRGIRVVQELPRRAVN
jgi:hypothetical protein